MTNKLLYIIKGLGGGILMIALLGFTPWLWKYYLVAGFIALIGLLWRRSVAASLKKNKN